MYIHFSLIWKVLIIKLRIKNKKIYAPIPKAYMDIFLRYWSLIGSEYTSYWIKQLKDSTHKNV